MSLRSYVDIIITINIVIINIVTRIIIIIVIIINLFTEHIPKELIEQMFGVEQVHKYSRQLVLWVHNKKNNNNSNNKWTTQKNFFYPN